MLARFLACPCQRICIIGMNAYDASIFIEFYFNWLLFVTLVTIKGAYAPFIDLISINLVKCTKES